MKKASDCIHRQTLSDILKSRYIPDTLLQATVDIYTQKQNINKI